MTGSRRQYNDELLHKLQVSFHQVVLISCPLFLHLLYLTLSLLFLLLIFSLPTTPSSLNCFSALYYVSIFNIICYKYVRGQALKPTCSWLAWPQPITFSILLKIVECEQQCLAEINPIFVIISVKPSVFRGHDVKSLRGTIGSKEFRL